MMEAKNDTKKRLVAATCQIIQEKGMEGVTAREVAKRVGVTPTVIYRHFENLCHLIVLASITCISDYLDTLKKINDIEKDPIEKNILGWENFNRHAFANPPIYENLFWGKYNDQLEIALFDYYKIFPESLLYKQDAFLICSLLSGNIEERDYIWMRRGANEGMLDYEDARFLSRTNCLITHGMLMEHMADYTQPGVAEKAAQECTALIERNIRRYLK
jgi:Transcriptional regulator